MTAQLVRKINVPMLVELAEWVGQQEARRRLGLASEWDQEHWLARDTSLPTSCGTAACLAGYTTLRNGWVPTPAAAVALSLSPLDVLADGGIEDPEDFGDDSWDNGDVAAYVSRVRYEGRGKDRRIAEILETRYVPTVAAEILGIEEIVADQLFIGSNDYDDVMSIIEQLIGEAQERGDVTAKELAKL